jgi:hypothetical protein
LYAHSAADKLAAREPSLVGADTFSENIECFAGDNVIFAPGRDCHGRNGLSLRHGRRFIGHHTAHFGFRAGATGRKPHHPQGDDALRLKAKLESLERQRQPWIEDGCSWF